MSQTKTGNIFKEIGGEACFVGEKVEGTVTNANVMLNVMHCCPVKGI
jgi:hypothetical protein